MVKIPFCGQAYKERTLNANAQECVNLYPVVSPESGLPGDRGRIVMYPTPGYNLLYDVIASSGISGVGAIRGLFVINDTLYVVSGTKFIRVTGSGTYTATSLGTLTTSTGRCSITCNTVEITISDGANGYVFNLGSSAFTTISGGSWPAGGVTNLAFMDGYTLATVNASSRVIQSNLLASGTYGALAFVDVASYPDNNVGVFSDQSRLYILGPRLTEVRFNASSVPFAFQKDSGVLIQVGCVAWPTVVKVGNSIIWLMSDAAGKAYVGALDGYSTTPLSTAPINEALERYTRLDDAFAYTYREADTQFYSITFPSQGVTWVLDVGTKMWHQRSVGTRDLPDHYALWQGMHVVGDSSGKLWRMSQEYTTDDQGNGLLRKRSCQHISSENKTLFIDELNIEIEAGTAPVTGLYSGAPANTEASATLKVSKDHGYTWINCGVKTFGAQGQFTKRLTWYRLGRFRNGCIFELTVTDNVRTFIIGANARIRAGNK